MAINESLTHMGQWPYHKLIIMLSLIRIIYKNGNNIEVISYHVYYRTMVNDFFFYFIHRAMEENNNFTPPVSTPLNAVVVIFILHLLRNESMTMR